MKLNKLWVLLGCIIFIAAACNKPMQLKIGEKYLDIEIADNSATRTQGLSGRDSIPENSGMYFIFQSSSQHGFWMKDMKFALDFIWVKDGKVTEITSNIPPEPGVSESELKRYVPKESVDGMVEVNAGWAATNGIKVGDKVVLTK